MKKRVLTLVRELRDRARFLGYRFRQRRRARKNAKNDPNVYPLW